MKNKFTTIKLRFETSTIDFEQLDETHKPTMETNSLTKTNNLESFSLPLLTETGNYRLLFVKNVPNEREPDTSLRISVDFPTVYHLKIDG